MKRQNAGQIFVRPASLLLILLIATTFFFALAVSKHLGLSRADPSSRMRLHAIPVAISQIYHGRKHDYTAYWSVAMQFHNETPLAIAIQSAVTMPVSPQDRTYYWTADDRGLSDFVNIGFRLFGPSMSALFYYWYLLFGLSIFFAVARFRRDPTALTVIACGVISVAATLPALTRAASSAFAEASIHLTESRMFDVLAAVAAIHLILTMFRPAATPRWLNIGTMIAQAGLIAGCVHARTSVSWLFMGLLALGLFALLRRWQDFPKHPRANPVTAVLITVVIAWAGIHLYQRLMFNDAYRAQIGPRTFWHNVLMGLGANSTLAHTLNIELTDKSAIDAVITDMRKRNDPRLTEQWETQNILNSLGSHTTFDWRTYERVARDLIIRTFVAHPVTMLTLLLWDKPNEVIRTITCGFLAIDRTCEQTQAGVPRGRTQHVGKLRWVWLGLFVMLSGSLFLVRRNEPGPVRHGDPADVRGLVPAVLFMALVGLAPSIIVYPSVVQLGGCFVFALTTFGFWFILEAQRLGSRSS
jgi:hypothetical protein